MSGPEPLEYGQYYHIYNRGNNSETLFSEERNYDYFLKLYTKYIVPIAETYAYCLLDNHFHFLIRIKTIKTGPVSETGPVLKPRTPSRQFNNFFIAYSNAFNNVYQRTGALFESPFKRKIVDNDIYFTHLVTYIHRNPQKHGLIDDLHNWPYSSYQTILSTKPTLIERTIVLDWFQGIHGFEDAHTTEPDETMIKSLVLDV